MSKQYRIYSSLSYLKLIDALESKLEKMIVSDSERSMLEKAVDSLMNTDASLREKGSKVIIAFLLERV